MRIRVTSPQRAKVLEMSLNGVSRKRIAAELGISLANVGYLRGELIKALGLRSFEVGQLGLYEAFGHFEAEVKLRWVPNRPRGKKRV